MSNEVNIGKYLGAYKGMTGTVIGKGPTSFDFGRDGQSIDGPVFYINDAVNMADKLKVDVSFLFFLDEHQAQHWLGSHGVAAVCVTKHTNRVYDKGVNQVAYFPMREPDSRIFKPRTRKELAAYPQLYMGDGTICPLLHFAWMTGIGKIRFIGCDGINSREIVRKLTGGKDYNPAIPLTAGKGSGWKNNKIRHCQDALIDTFGMEAEYVGSACVPERDKPLFCSFATPNYAAHLERLRASAVALGIDLTYQYLADNGKWVENCALKPRYIRSVIIANPGRRIIWVDADAEFKSVPTYFDTIPDDIDCAFAVRGGKEVLSGTVYIGATDMGLNLVDNWCIDQERRKDVWDQKVLAQVAARTKYRTAILPPEYTFIFDLTAKEYPGLEPVILHHQASRVAKR